MERAEFASIEAAMKSQSRHPSLSSFYPAIYYFLTWKACQVLKDKIEKAIQIEEGKIFCWLYDTKNKFVCSLFINIVKSFIKEKKESLLNFICYK